MAESEEEFMELVVSYIFQGTLVFVIVAIAAHIGAVSAAQRGRRKLAKGLAWTAFIATALMTAVYAASVLLGGDLFNLLFAALWGWFASRDWRLIRQLG